MGVLPARRLAAGLAMRRAVPYLLGLFHLAAFHALFRFYRGSFLGGDSGEFLRITETLRSGAPAADAAKPLGYPLAVAALGWLPGGDIAHALAVNAACYLGTIALIGAIARRLGCAPGQARIAQMLFALIPNCAAWSNLVLSDTMAMLLFTAALRAFLMPGEPSKAAWHPAAALGGLLGALSVTRTEYLAFLPVVSLLLASRRQPARRRIAFVAVVWAAAAPWLFLQPAIVRSWIPPRQSAFVDIWRSRYDLELTQFRFHQLPVLAERLARGELSSSGISGAVQGLRQSASGDAPVDAALLASVEQDCRPI